MITMTPKLKEMLDELKLSNAETFYHSLHVKNLCCKMIRLMNEDKVTNYTPVEIDAICKGALLHDIGKLMVKNFILTKDAALTSEEKEKIRLHTKLGFEAICDELADNEYEIIKNICLYHHERIDGKGYHGKTDLPQYVELVAACDVFDALYSDRVYRDGFSYSKTFDIIESGGSGYFSDYIIRYLKKAAAEHIE